MSARRDLQAIADSLAAQAVQALQPQPTGTGGLRLDPERAISFTRAAKTALEGVALTENVTGSDIDRALSELQAELDQTGTLSASVELDAANFLKVVLDELANAQRQAKIGKDSQDAYLTLRLEMQRMADQFAHAGTNTATRNAERIRMVLDEAAQIAPQAGHVASVETAQ